MRIGIIDIEPKIMNTALMQIACYHKNRGDTVEWATPLQYDQFDYLYCSSLFDYTDKREVPKRAICGGTGFDVISRLSRAIEDCDLDYSIYPKCKTSYLWFSRGCIRKCPWCVVPQKEGDIHLALPKNNNPNGKYITICDNNFFANKYWSHAIRLLLEDQEPVDFQGVDVRLLNKRRCEALNSLRHYKQIKIAWDDPKDKSILPSIKKALRFIPARKLMCYVLIGYSSTEDENLCRVETLRSLGIDPFVMPYNRRDLYQKSFARWVNHKAIYRKVKWQDYRGRVEAQKRNKDGDVYYDD